MEIDENLCRAELTASQRTGYTKRRKQIWEALHPEEIQVRQVVAPVIGYASPPPQTQGFAAATAAATGQSKATTNRAIARADALGDEALTKVAHTSLDSGVELDALAKMSFWRILEQQVPVLHLVALNLRWDKMSHLKLQRTVGHVRKPKDSQPHLPLVSQGTPWGVAAWVNSAVSVF